MSDSTYQCKLHSTYCVTGDPEVCLSDKCDVAACPARDHATNTGNNCDLSPGDGFACICFEGYCTGATGSCTVSGTCN